jgi:hypothetical protein
MNSAGATRQRVELTPEKKIAQSANAIFVFALPKTRR